MINNWARAKGDNTDGLGYNIDLFDYAFRPAIQQNYTCRYVEVVSVLVILL